MRAVSLLSTFLVGSVCSAESTTNLSSVAESGPIKVEWDNFWDLVVDK